MEAPADGEPSAEAVLGTAEEPPGAGMTDRGPTYAAAATSRCTYGRRSSRRRLPTSSSAREESAPDDLLDVLASLDPVRSFHTTEEIWEALGGEREERYDPAATIGEEGRPSAESPSARLEPRVPVRPPAPAARATFRRDTGGARSSRSIVVGARRCPLRALATGDGAVEHRVRSRDRRLLPAQDRRTCAPLILRSRSDLRNQRRPRRLHRVPRTGAWHRSAGDRPAPRTHGHRRRPAAPRHPAPQLTKRVLLRHGSGRERLRVVDHDRGIAVAWPAELHDTPDVLEGVVPGASLEPVHAVPDGSLPSLAASAASARAGPRLSSVGGHAHPDLNR